MNFIQQWTESFLAVVAAMGRLNESLMRAGESMRRLGDVFPRRHRYGRPRPRNYRARSRKCYSS